MKNTFLLIIFLLATITVFGQSADAIVGKWINSDSEAHIQIYKKGNQYYGKLVWLKNPNDGGKAKQDVKNPNANLRSRAILGLEILKGFSFNDGVWENGTIYDPKSGKTYSCKLTIHEKDKLNVRGYIGISLIGRTDTWTRVK